mmetsp:Transcript_92520/g.293409  ORF Transcript_92520/g.293409 Transcript_92520/m.293409 type:complete len:485 (+) Transcript_92520:115-1569(+)
MSPAPSPSVEEGRSVRTISTVALVLVAALCCVTALGAILDARRRAKGGSTRSGCWVFGLFVSSYALLVPGLVMRLFEFHISAMNGAMRLQADESTISFINMLAKTGGWVGSAFVVLFAIVIPVLKILMFAIGELWRDSSSSSRVAHARGCIAVIQVISKWACPDMFAYILMTFLIRSLSHPPMLDGAMQLGIGFTCFTLFCVGSTVSSLGMRLPSPLREDDESDEAERAQDGPELPCMLKHLGPRGAHRLAAALLVAWVALFALGMFLPCMALRLDVQGLVENGTIPRVALDLVVNQLRLPEKARADVSIWGCMVQLARWTCNGDVNNIIAFIMLAVFVALFTLLDVMALVQVIELRGGHAGRRKLAWTEPSKMMSVSRVLGKLCMADVLVMGVIVVILSGSIYKSKGLVLAPRWGLACLFAAELCHYSVRGLLALALAGDAPESAPSSPSSSGSSGSSSRAAGARGGCASQAAEEEAGRAAIA